MEPSSNPTAFEDPRARFKFQILLQDYQDLEKETDAMKKKMQMMKQRKMTLLAEVRFLKRRFEFLTKNNSLHLKQSQNPVKGKPRISEMQSKQIAKKRNYPTKGAVTGFESNKKSRIGNTKKAASEIPKPRLTQKPAKGKGMAYREFSPVFDLNQGDVVSIPMLNSGSVFELNQKERPQSAKEASVLSRAPVFDLNQISRDEEELQNNTEFVGMEEARRSSILGGSEEQLNSVKLPGCRTVGNGSKAGKRKITWQDQVALRV
ncbi:hypothetical protein CRG98_027287 [Punica granatum]|nr:hypothetical protein CRG98_027287 [Punica granatum]